MYEAHDLERLEQIIALRYLGISLRQIGSLLDSNPGDMAGALRVQWRLLEEKRRMLRLAIQAIAEAESRILSGSAPDSAVLKKIIELIEM